MPVRPCFVHRRSDSGEVRNQQGRRGQVPVPPESPNGEIIAASQGYETKASAEKGIEAIKAHAPNAKVEAAVPIWPLMPTDWRTTRTRWSSLSRRFAPMPQRQQIPAPGHLGQNRTLIPASNSTVN